MSPVPDKRRHKIDHVLHVPWQRRRDFNPVPAAWMRKGQRVGVEHEATHPKVGPEKLILGAVSMGCIADDGVKDVL